MRLKAGGLIFWSLAIYAHIVTTVKTEFVKHIKMVDFRVGGMMSPGINCFENTLGPLGSVQLLYKQVLPNSGPHPPLYIT